MEYWGGTMPGGLQVKLLTLSTILPTWHRKGGGHLEQSGRGGKAQQLRICGIETLRRQLDTLRIQDALHLRHLHLQNNMLVSDKTQNKTRPITKDPGSSQPLLDTQYLAERFSRIANSNQ